MADVVREHVEIVPGAGGPKPRIAGHRILVQDVAVWHEKLGRSPDEIVHDHPTITIADVYAALAYYWDHRDEMERAITEERALVEELRRDCSGPLQEKLKRYQGGYDAIPAGRARSRLRRGRTQTTGNRRDHHGRGWSARSVRC